ncbi:hypothetical protein FRC10_006944 [Ceratobasidium sp. 414]|nr:hypothetical protein FRC10_006944 [Ceratobasidium sp. 414]
MQVLVSTEALTLGADFPNVKQVIQYFPPDDMMTSLQRSGRAARRTGLTGMCITMIPLRTYQKTLKICIDTGDTMTLVETDVDQKSSDEEPEYSHSEREQDDKDNEEGMADRERSEGEVDELDETQDNELEGQPGQEKAGSNNRLHDPPWTLPWRAI